MNPLLLPPRLVLRALDDLHSLAVSAAALPEIEARLTGRLDRVDAVASAALERLEHLDKRAGQVLDQADRVGDRLDSVDDHAARMVAVAERAQHDIPAMEQILESVKDLNRVAAVLAQAVEPLQGLSERLGRVADRFPGARR